MSQETHPRQGMHICSRGRSRERHKSPRGDSFDSMGDSGSSAVVLEVAKIQNFDIGHKQLLVVNEKNQWEYLGVYMMSSL